MKGNCECCGEYENDLIKCNKCNGFFCDGCIDKHECEKK